jgi:hypothetical protein
MFEEPHSLPLVGLLDHRTGQAGEPDATQFKQRISLFVEPLPYIETSDLETHLLECYLLVDDYLQSNPKVAAWRRSNNDDPDFTDAEVIVIALMRGDFRTDTLKRTYQLAIANTKGAFPDRAGYKQWIRRLRQLPDRVRLLAEDGAKFGARGLGPLVLQVQDPCAHPSTDTDDNHRYVSSR